MSLTSVQPFAISDVQDAVFRYCRERGADPSFVVIDTDSFRAILNFIASALDARGISPARARLCGIEVVVIPTDGIPMLKVVGTPGEEALRP